MLRSLNEMKGYVVQTTDGFKGKVNDFFFDDWKWNIRYLVVDTGKWLPGRLVLIHPPAFKKPLWEKLQFVYSQKKDKLCAFVLKKTTCNNSWENI